MRTRFIAILALIVGISFAVAACGGSTSPTSITSITVSGLPPAAGASSQLVATAQLSDGTTRDVTSTATWLSTNTAVATVSSTGVVTGVAAGTASITATVNNTTGTFQITVS